MGKSKKPKPAPVLPEAPLLPDVESSISGSDKNKRRKRAQSSNILTGPRGDLSPASTAPKTLLGA